MSDDEHYYMSEDGSDTDDEEFEPGQSTAQSLPYPKNAPIIIDHAHHLKMKQELSLIHI